MAVPASAVQPPPPHFGGGEWGGRHYSGGQDPQKVIGFDHFRGQDPQKGHRF